MSHLVGLSQVQLFRAVSRADLAGFSTITCEETLELLREKKPVVLVDAREARAFEYAHLPGAVNLQPSALESPRSLNRPDKSPPIIVYCDGPACDAAVRTARKLRAGGYKDLRILEAGWQEWVAKGYPQEK